MIIMLMKWKICWRKIKAFIQRYKTAYVNLQLFTESEYIFRGKES